MSGSVTAVPQLFIGMLNVDFVVWLPDCRYLNERMLWVVLVRVYGNMQEQQSATLLHNNACLTDLRKAE